MYLSGRPSGIIGRIYSTFVQHSAVTATAHNEEQNAAANSNDDVYMCRRRFCHRHTHTCIHTRCDRCSVDNLRHTFWLRQTQAEVKGRAGSLGIPLTGFIKPEFRAAVVTERRILGAVMAISCAFIKL